NLPPVPEWNTDFPEVLICEMAENGNVNLVLGKALSVLPEAELFEPVRNPLHRNSADFPLASTPAGGSVHILLAKDCTRSRVGAHVVQWSSADIATVHAMSALGQERTSDHLLRYRRNSASRQTSAKGLNTAGSSSAQTAALICSILLLKKKSLGMSNAPVARQCVARVLSSMVKFLAAAQ